MKPDDDAYIGYLVSDVARLMRTVFDRRVRKLGLTRSQWLLLSRLHRRPGASQTELAEMLEVEKASAGRMVDRMERNGWVVRRADAADRRVKRIHLTREAERVHARMWVVAQATVDDALANLTAAERTQLARLMGRAKARLLALANGDAASATPSRRRTP
ncbi:MarR family transcriptional regulator [Vineibacter terrae]|uniref:MarR family transcriptional regulator n=1 Tax=Vineibacter terrae TaxID=2586908 RepID=A0A5C8PL99_9HYPH|nr:MarR family transcriptional regulator [Vineibacter terrae]TXL74794.1 MarR family transcriptional regulator [Vineibacter terrae]